MFSQPRPGTTQGFGTGFSTQPPAPSAVQGPPGGFGFPSTNTSTNITSMGAPAWGASAASAPPAATAASPWGAKPATTTTFAAGGAWGTQPGAAPAALGWGVQPQAQPASVGAWGMQAQQQLQPQQQQQFAQPQPNYVALQDFARQSALASFLMELDKAYDALGPKCRFRVFVYNNCPPGQVMDAVQKERFIAFLHGGGVPEEDWMAAMQSNPEPSHMFPQPLHFAQELQQRCEKQKVELKRLADLAEGYLRDVESVAALDEANKSRAKVLRQEDVMLRRRWYLLQQKLEVLSRLGQRSGEESLLLREVEQLRQTLAAPGRFRDALEGLQPLLDSEAELCAEQQSVLAQATRRPSPGGKTGDGEGGVGASHGLLRSHVNSKVMEGWVEFAKQMQDGIQSLNGLLERDTKDMVAIRERASQ